MSTKNKSNNSTELKNASDRFDAACRLVKNNKKLGKNMNDDELGKLYGLYKQSTEGNCSVKEPPNRLLDNTGYMKWKYWKKYEGMEISDSMNNYADLVLDMHDKYTK